MEQLRDIDHVGIAVHDLTASISWYGEAFGARVAHVEDVDHDGVREALLSVGGSFIQLLTPTRPDSTVAHFLERHGEGLHHIAYRVDNCAEALRQVAASGAPLIDVIPRPGSRQTTIGFVHPHGAMGCLIELVEVHHSTAASE